MGHRWPGMVAALTLLGIGAWCDVAWCQQSDRRSRDEPEVCLETGGRYGYCDVLGFTPDGKWLYAAGDDKVVRLWPCLWRETPGSLVLDRSAGQVLRWRAWRDQLGGIKAVAVSPDGQRLAVGGYGLRISSVAILDRSSGRTLALTWPRVAEGQTHYDAVTAIAFHPDGQRLVFGTADGSLWLWQPEKLPQVEEDGRSWSAPQRLGRCQAPVGPVTAYCVPRTLHFGDEHTVTVLDSYGQAWAFPVQGRFSDQPDVPPPAGRKLFDVHQGAGPRWGVHQAAWSPDGRWLAVALQGPAVLLRSRDGRQHYRCDLPVDHFPRSLAWRADARQLAVGVGAALPAQPGQLRFFLEADDHIRLYDVPPAAASPTVSTPAFRSLRHQGRAEALAYHPKQLEYLAVAGGPADQITLWKLTAHNADVASQLCGVGRQLYGVNLSVDGAVLGVQTQRATDANDPNGRGAGPWLRFHLLRLRPTADTSPPWVGVRRQERGWQVEPDPHSRFVWYVVRRQDNGPTQRWRLLLDPDQDQAPTCYTFVPTAADRPARLLVGHYYGCSLFELDPARLRTDPRTGQQQLLRSKLFIGHAAEVHAVVADASGQWFVTASADQTVAAWNLADWPAQAVLGARVAIQSDKLVITAVDVGSPAWEAGLSPGDVLELLAVDGRLLWDRRPGRPPHGTLEQAAAALHQPQSGIEYFFAWQTGPTRRASLTRLKQRPLWKWFPIFDDQDRWCDAVMWMWYGNYYYTTSVHGDRYLGWHVNDAAVEGTPQFHPLQRFRHLFLQPAVIRRLVQTRSVAAALHTARGDRSVRPSFREVEPPLLELAVAQTEVRTAAVSLRLRIRPPGNHPDYWPQRLELWINDYRYRVWDLRREPQLQIDLMVAATLFRQGENRLTAVTHHPDRGRAVAVHTLTYTPPRPVQPQLFGLLAGINVYAATGQDQTLRSRGWHQLNRARDDAVALQQACLHYQGTGRCFAQATLHLLVDEQVRRTSLYQTFAQLEQRQQQGQLRPDDLLIVFFSGHGDVLSLQEWPGYAPDPSARPSSPEPARMADAGTFVLCCQDYTPATAAQTALRCDELFELLARLNCRKLVLLDACRSGNAAEAGLWRQVLPSEHGPIVLAACDLHEQSYEDERLRHGVFTYALLEALGARFRAADRDSDGVLTAAELYRYLAQRVPELLRHTPHGPRQHPICFPPLDAMPHLPLLSR
ncbi:MAG: caspase family protein [Gemmataceae bacterium]|nr:caspase family protein [Gemmataceae bacterium]MDW8244430.1 caspase family protein [Thermogemmata sp.]